MDIRASDITSFAAYLSSATVALSGNILESLNNNAPACGVMLGTATFGLNWYFQRKRSCTSPSNRKCEYHEIPLPSLTQRKQPIMKQNILSIALLVTLVYFINDSLDRSDRQIKAGNDQAATYTASLEKLSKQDALTDERVENAVEKQAEANEKMAGELKALTEALKSKNERSTRAKQNCKRWWCKSKAIQRMDCRRPTW